MDLTMRVTQWLAMPAARLVHAAHHSEGRSGPRSGDDPRATRRRRGHAATRAASAPGFVQEAGETGQRF
jgi:hypothetical protein